LSHWTGVGVPAGIMRSRRNPSAGGIPGGYDRSVVRTSLGPNFAKLWTASTVSNLGDGVTLVAGPLLAATLTRDPLAIAALSFCQRLPWLLFSLLSGALVDRLDRRRVMATVDLFRAVVMGLLAVAVLLDAASIPLLCATFFLLGSAETLFDNAAISVLPAVVPKASLTRANGRLLGAQIVTNDLAAPALGGLLFAAAAAVPFLLDAGSFVAAAALVAAMRGSFRVRPPAGAGRATLRADIAEGVRWLAGHRLLRLLGVAIGLMNLTLSAATAILVLYAQERLGLGSTGFGVLIACLAIGGIWASLVTERIVGRLGPATTMRVGLLVEASTHLVLALTSSPLVAGGILALFGFHAMVWSTVSISLRQELIPGRLLGRVNSGYAVLSYGGSSLGALLGGLVARRFGLTAPFWSGFVAIALLAAVAWPTLNTGRVRAAREQAAADG
jgi:MFS family permease